MRFYAARYYDGAGKWDVALYPMDCPPDDCPHDFDLLFTRLHWRRLGCRAPTRDETMMVDLGATEVERPRWRAIETEVKG
jgi:hypothetical protein